MNLELNRSYTAKNLANMVRQAYGTGYYSRIIYSLVPQPDSTCKIVFDVTENPFTFAKLGIHYNRFTGIGIIGNLTARNFFITNSRSSVTVNIGESFRIRGEHLQYLGRLKNFALIAETQFDRFEVNTYNEYKQDGLYKQTFFKVGERFQFSPSRSFSIGTGHANKFHSQRRLTIKVMGQATRGNSTIFYLYIGNIRINNVRQCFTYNSNSSFFNSTPDERPAIRYCSLQCDKTGALCYAS
jgi:NTE family protein